MKVIAFVATSDAPRARAFYEDVLQLRFVADEPFALVFHSAGTMVRIQKVDAVAAPPHTTLGWEVDDLDAQVDGLLSRGAHFERYGFMEQDARGIWTAPGGTRVAWLKDPDGNLLSLSQST